MVALFGNGKSKNWTLSSYLRGNKGEEIENLNSQKEEWSYISGKC
jgi:hypothetical protein